MSLTSFTKSRNPNLVFFHKRAMYKWGQLWAAPAVSEGSPLRVERPPSLRFSINSPWLKTRSKQATALRSSFLRKHHLRSLTLPKADVKRPQKGSISIRNNPQNKQNPLGRRKNMNRLISCCSFVGRICSTLFLALPGGHRAIRRLPPMVATVKPPNPSLSKGSEKVQTKPLR